MHTNWFFRGILEVGLAMFKWNNLKLLYAAIPILPIHALGITIKLEVNMKLQGPYLEQRHLKIRGFAPHNFSYSGNEPCCCCCSRYVGCKNILCLYVTASAIAPSRSSSRAGASLEMCHLPSFVQLGHIRSAYVSTLNSYRAASATS